MGFSTFSLFSLVYVCSGYDMFEGFFKTSDPCFPAYTHEKCKRTLWQEYQPSYKGADQNTPTTKIWLFTAKSPSKAEQLHECGGGLPPDSTFNPEHHTEIFIHGWTDGPCRTAWQREMKEQLFIKGKYNVILTDWTWGNLPDYATAALNAKVVGQQIAYALKKITSQTNYDCRKFHITGNSFGVIAASLAGKLMKGSCRLGRITALDAALAPLKYASDEELLNPSDAEFVDVMHTNIGDCFPFNIGTPRLMGHVDFFVNDAVHQYSCLNYIWQSYLKLDFFYATASFYPALCYHIQSIQYFKVSINAHDKQFIGVECNSLEEWKSGKCPRNCEGSDSKCMVMGMDTPLYWNASDTKRRIYYVPTTLSCPYVDHTDFTGLPLTPIKTDLMS